jgi:dipeptidyl aminopeptidase/acylaminoacyl peptidase
MKATLLNEESAVERANFSGVLTLALSVLAVSTASPQSAGVETVVRPMPHLASAASGLPMTIRPIGSAIANDSRKPFGVKESIELNTIVTIDGYHPKADKPEENIALYSPDGSQFLVRTRRGDVATNTIIETIYTITASDVSRILTGRLEAGPPKIVVEIPIRDDYDLVRSIHWLDNNKIDFIGPDSSGILQGWSADVRTQALTQLTHSSTNVSGFAATAERVIYFADQPPARSRPMPVVLPFIEYEFAEDAHPSRPYWEDRRTGEVRSIGDSLFRLSSDCLDIWPSPDGRLAIAMQPVQNPPPHWANYLGRTPGVRSDSRIFADTTLYTDPTSQTSFFAARFVVLDLEKGSIRPLLDAPSGYIAHTALYRSFNVWWLNDQRSVIVSNTFLPLNGNGPQETARRSREPAIAQIDVVDGTVRLIARIPLLSAEKADYREDVSWDDLSGTLTLSEITGDVTTSRQYRSGGGGWKQFGQRAGGAREFTVAARQDIARRPKLLARGSMCGCEKLLFDPEPELDKFSLGHVELVNWNGPPNGTWDGKWQGELIYPVGYSYGTRYPLVVLTHASASKPGEFLIDGPTGITTAMPAQALANAGIMVLQIFDAACFTGDLRESFVCAEGYRNGIRFLSDRGLIDDRRVGLIAFSRTGVVTGRLLAEYPDLLTAVDISDGFWWGYVTHTLFIPDVGETATQARALTSGLNHRESITEAENDPLYKWSDSRTAIRLEANGRGSLLTMGEAVSILHAARHPADFLYFPQGAHTLLMPDERMASQGGNVDWFRFWLQDYEDPDPGKRDQYERWRALRQLKDAKPANR